MALGARTPSSDPSPDLSPRLCRRRAQSPAPPAPPAPPARPRSPTPRAGRRSARPRPCRPRPPRPPDPAPAPCAAQTRLVSLGNRGAPRGAAGGRGAGRRGAGGGRLKGARAAGRKGQPPQEAGMELEGDLRDDNKLKRGLPRDLPASPNLDRYKIARQLTEKAIKEKKIFSIYGHYPVIRATLRRSGWVEKKFHFLPKVTARAQDRSEGLAESKCTEGKENQKVAVQKEEDVHDVMSRLVKNEMPYFLWTVKRDVIDYHSLHCDQMLNHYGKTASFTTKIGLCLNLRSLPWYVQDNPDTFFPRCYGLSVESEKQAFLDDFRRTVASSILKWVVSHQDWGEAGSGRDEAGDSGSCNEKGPGSSDAKPTGLSGQLVDTACKVCQAYLQQLEHEDIDTCEDAARGLTEDAWKDLTQQYYALVHGNAYISSSRSHFSKCQALLNKLSSVNPQTEIDGLKNIWIVKPAAKSRGRDIVCMNRVEEILALVAADHPPAKDSRWVVQKYIETPLLIHDTKFDIRQWFLVTDWNPLTIWFYKESYLRFSTQHFSLDNLDSAVHLCNNSIQKHLQNAAARSPQLPPYNMWSSARFRQYLQQRGQGSAWGGLIYPAMKRAVAHTLRVAQGHVAARRNSFELYGADFVLGRDFRPWLLEINSSPTMHASTPVTAQLCARVQEDVLRVVVGRRHDRGCDVGNFELLWRQPAVGLPPAHGSNLRVEGVSVRKAKKPVPPLSSFQDSPSLLDLQLPRGRRLTASAEPAPGPPKAALQGDSQRRDTEGLTGSLPRPLKRPPAGSGKVKSIHTEAGRSACDFQHVDSKTPKAGLKAASGRPLDPDGLPPMSRNMKTQPPRALGLPRELPTPCLLCCGSLPPARPCKRCRSFCASVLQGGSFVPLGGHSSP